MNITEFREKGEELVDYIADYLNSISERPVTPNVIPGFLQSLLPPEAPNNAESFETIMGDFEQHILPGLTHWQHRRFHAYFPCATSFPSILAEMFSDVIGCVGFEWNLSPAAMELEKIVMDWFGKMIGLPDKFLHWGTDSIGGGVILNTASECIFRSMYMARQEAVDRLKQKNESLSEHLLFSSLIAYCSKESHSCVEKAAIILMLNIKILETDENYRLRGETVAKAVQADKEHGLIPFFVSITIGSTSCCSCDPIDELGPVCESNGIWLHVDSAYGGNALVCPEFQHLLKGIEYASSFDINPVKWLLIGLDCSALWVTDSSKLLQYPVIDKTVLHHDFEKDGIHTSRKRFRALKLWFVMRNYGIEGLQEHIRHHVRLAKIFEGHVRADKRFEFMASQFGLVCLRLIGTNALNKKLYLTINGSRKIHLTACQLKEKYVIRFCVCATQANEEDMAYAWSVISEFASELLETNEKKSQDLWPV